jgi:hypothetical protein
MSGRVSFFTRMPHSPPLARGTRQSPQTRGGHGGAAGQDNGTKCRLEFHTRLCILKPKESVDPFTFESGNQLAIDRQDRRGVNVPAFQKRCRLGINQDVFHSECYTCGPQVVFQLFAGHSERRGIDDHFLCHTVFLGLVLRTAIAPASLARGSCTVRVSERCGNLCFLYHTAFSTLICGTQCLRLC